MDSNNFFLKGYEDAVSFLVIDVKKCGPDMEGNWVQFYHNDASPLRTRRMDVS
jgi:hypothetical protein